MKLLSISTDNIRWHSSIGRPVKELAKRIMHRPHNEAPVSANLFWKGDMWKSVRLWEFRKPPAGTLPITHALTAQETKTTIMALPNELLFITFDYLSPNDLVNIYPTNRRMQALVTTTLLPTIEKLNADIGKIESVAQDERAGAFGTALDVIEKILPSGIRREPLERLAARLVDISPRQRHRCLNRLYGLTSTLPVQEQFNLVNQSAYHVFSLQQEHVKASLHRACTLIRHFPDEKKKEAANSLKEQLRGAVIWYKRSDLDNTIDALIGDTNEPSIAGVHDLIHSDKVTVFDNALAAIGKLPPAFQPDRLARLTNSLKFVPNEEQGPRLNRLYELAASMPLAKQPSHVALHSHLFRLPLEKMEASFNKACDLIRSLPNDADRRKSIIKMKVVLRSSPLNDKHTYLARIDDPNFWQSPT